MVQPVTIETYEQRTLLFVPAVFLAIATATVGTRLYVRKTQRQAYFVHDYLCLTALFLTYCCYINLVLAIVYGGLGKPITELSLDNINFVFKALLGITILWGTTVSVVQISILALYTQVFNVLNWHKYTCYATMAIVGVWWASYFVASLTSCIPIEKFWTPEIPGTCINEVAFCRGAGLSHLFLDIFILTFSLPIVWGLNTQSRNKLVISIIFLIGLLATLSGILRLDCLIPLIPYDAANFTQSSWLGCLFELLENTCGIICSCMPMFPYLLRRLGSSDFGGFVKGVLYNIQTTMSLKRLLSTARTSHENTSAQPQNVEHNGQFENNSYRILVERHDGQSAKSTKDIPLEDVKVTKTWNVTE